MLYKKKWPLVVFLVPGLLFMLVFLYIPFVQNIKNSFYDMTAIIEMPGTEWKFIGFENYKKLFTDPDVRTALVNSLKMMVLTVIFEVGIAFVLAVMVSQIKKLQQLFRTVYFFPVVISATAIGLLFKLFYNYNGGMLNQILESIGAKPVNWLSPGLAFIMVCIPTLWSYIGFYFVILLTGLSDIPDDIYEAASIDGCSRFQAYWRIILPFSLPGVASVGVFTLMNVWNEYTIASIFIQDKNLRTLSVGIRQFMMQNTTDWASMSAAATIAVLPAFVMIIFAQKYLVGGLTSGSVKG